MEVDPAVSLMIDDILNYPSDIGEENDDDDKTKAPSSSSLETNPNSLHPDDHSRSFPEFAEEELPWILDKEAFPAVETCFGILSDNPGIVMAHESPVSVLENSSGSSNSNSNSSTITSCCGNVQVPVHHPVGARSKRRPRRRRGFADLPGQQYWRWSKTNIKNIKQDLPTLPPQSSTTIGRRCQHCQAEKTPQWRAGPMGPKTLCNACGVRYKSGRLVPEYRPASSPTFSSVAHSNSHRKIMEMRKQKQLGGMMVNEVCGYRVG
ncbi:GATA transcription factor 1 [Cornus florida]|uniref:GATA transcription factor 1 n=1 Tax=Cornus florida TaxID=4283 RepID=UPI0028990263|nr:GATA transcription factor 1 [Cornus florida]